MKTWFSSIAPFIPIFNGEKYEWWSIKVKTLLRSEDLWELVEYGFVDILDPTKEEKEMLRENKKRDAKALFILQQAVHETIFSRIASATTSKQAWSILKNDFQGDSKVITMRLQSLRRDFENLLMKNDESINDFLSRAMAKVSQMRVYGEQISDEIIVAKVLSTLTPKFDHVVAAVEEAKDENVQIAMSLNKYASRQFDHEKVPIHYREAVEKRVWRKAMVEEMQAIEKNRTWEMVDLPEGKHAINLNWVFRTKLAADGRIQKHKARLVARESAQHQGIDYEETFFPVARFETLRIILALAAQLHWQVYQFDVKSTILNGEIQEEVYVAQPEGFIKRGKETAVYRLHKALYGLKQAPRAWYSKIDGYFKKNGYIRSENEPTLYVKREGKSDFIIICIYFDDIIYTSSSNSLVDEFKSQMLSEFEMSDMGVLHHFLGLEVYQVEDGIFISQRKYARGILKKFGMLSCKPAAVPLNISEKLRQEDGAIMADARRFRSLVGGLIYLAHTRPDITFPVGVISRYMRQPSKIHYRAAKWVLRYIAGTMEYGIWYSISSNFKLCGFTDSDWAECLDDRKSVSANAFTLGSGAISWSSEKQEYVALSVLEAKYVAASSAECQAKWLRRMLADLQHEQNGATEIFCDNKRFTSSKKRAALHSRVRHVASHHHCIRDLFEEQEVVFKHCSTNEQVARMLARALSEEELCFFRRSLGVCNFESGEAVEWFC